MPGNLHGAGGRRAGSRSAGEPRRPPGRFPNGFGGAWDGSPATCRGRVRSETWCPSCRPRRPTTTSRKLPRMKTTACRWCRPCTRTCFPCCRPTRPDRNPSLARRPGRGRSLRRSGTCRPPEQERKAGHENAAPANAFQDSASRTAGAVSACQAGNGPEYDARASRTLPTPPDPLPWTLPTPAVRPQPRVLSN